MLHPFGGLRGRRGRVVLRRTCRRRCRRMLCRGRRGQGIGQRGLWLCAICRPEGSPAMLRHGGVSDVSGLSETTPTTPAQHGRALVVGSLGVTQILAWGSSYYLPAV